MCAAKEINSGVTPFTNMPLNPQVLYGWGKQEGSCPKCGLKKVPLDYLSISVKPNQIDILNSVNIFMLDRLNHST